MSDYDAIVIGTGFGGAVAACRLAQAGLNVRVLERGRRYPMGAFPRDWHNPANGWLWPIDQGLFDVKPFNQMMVVQGAGYGGGSLIYANVHLRAPEDVFAQGWPAGYARQALDPYYDLVAYMLEITPITSSRYKGMPPKTIAMKKVADKLGRSAQFCYPNIAVNFGEPGVVHDNKFQVPQNGCTYCGECDIGCNIHAKNTLDLNYLALAERSRASVSVRCEVVKIEPASTGYRVTYKDWTGGGREYAIDAPRVFLCAGAVNSTELLLRCRDQHKTLPKLSSQLGNRYSGNGDFLAFAFDGADKLEPSNGPTITTGIVYDRPDGLKTWFIFEEGGYPKEIGAVLQVLNGKAGWLKSLGIATRAEIERAISSAAAGKIAQESPAAAHSAVFLAMGRDAATGRIRLTPVTNTLRVEWDVPANLPLYDAETGLSTDIANALGGTVAFNPFWDKAGIPVSVHNLGGCVMADSVDHGVTDGFGQVYNYPGLYVLDGAILPAATGVNPSHTIAAVAERNIETVIRSLPGKANWRAPEAGAAQRIIDPVSQLTIPPEGTAAPATRPIALSFTERMKGFIDKGHVPPDDYSGGDKAGQRNGTRVEFTLTITMPDLDRALVEKSHAGVANGTIHVDGFTGPGGAPVDGGVFNLFVETGDLYERKMLYALPFFGADGMPYLLDGFKEVKDDGHFDVWGATSTLYTVIRAGHDHTGAILASGIMHIHLDDFMHQLTTFRVSGTDDRTKQLAALDRFGRMFMGTLWDVFAKPRLP